MRKRKNVKDKKKSDEGKKQDVKKSDEGKKQDARKSSDASEKKKREYRGSLKKNVDWNEKDKKG